MVGGRCACLVVELVVLFLEPSILEAETLELRGRQGRAARERCQPR